MSSVAGRPAAHLGDQVIGLWPNSGVVTLAIITAPQLSDRPPPDQAGEIGGRGEGEFVVVHPGRQGKRLRRLHPVIVEVTLHHGRGSVVRARLALRADRHGLGATWVEGAARRRIDGIRKRQAELTLGHAQARLRREHRLQQGHCVRVARAGSKSMIANDVMDLPQPDSPTMQSVCPLSTLKSILLTACSSPAPTVMSTLRF